MKVGIIGAGAWGSALAISASDNMDDVVLWSFDGTIMNFPGVEIPKNITISQQISDMKNMDIWLVVVPSQFFRETIQKCRSFWQNQPIIICTKGMESGTNKFMYEILADEIPEIKNTGQIGILSGPQFAAEVAAYAQTGATVAASDAVFKTVLGAFSGLQLEQTDDLTGVSVCGAGKNAVAILMGYLDGIGAGENEKALKLTQSWDEIASFGRYFGAKTETFLKLCGIGDLFLTATSKTSRNFMAGVKIAKNELLNGDTVEGVAAMRAICARAELNNIQMPILAEFNKKCQASVSG